jgi:hypothetical protein
MLLAGGDSQSSSHAVGAELAALAAAEEFVRRPHDFTEVAVQ